MKHKDSENQRGLIIKVQRYCVQDGPGIRSTIFFKGCPLRCLWCSSPETHNNYPEIIFFEEKCIESCDQCIAACQKGAIHKDGVKTIIDRGVCNICGKCSQVCPSGALSLVGYSVGIQNLLEEIAKDKTFYEVSGGGVTFSGGEPLFQPKFALEFAKKCKENGFSVAIDTSGFCNSKTLQSILQYIDLVLFDIKFIHPIKHQKYTSVRNDIILENAKLVSNILNKKGIF
ncbi:MAG: glycyl-radical enzyme activating protein [Bacteroidia bacterium]|nr:glycyl-radical enzyme activating protein [Bacteroidia bacterium]